MKMFIRTIVLACKYFIYKRMQIHGNNNMQRQRKKLVAERVSLCLISKYKTIRSNNVAHSG